MQGVDVKNSSEGVTASVYILDEIGIGALSHKEFIDNINNTGANNLDIYISSPGGSVDHALAIYDFIKSFPGRTTAKLSGLVASAATFIASAADKVEMSENAIYMIHRAWGLAVGNSDELRHTASVYDKFEDKVINIYHKRTGLRKSKIKELLDAETWMDASEAKENGFVDKITTPSKLAAKIDLSSLQAKGFNKIPDEKIQLLNNYDSDMNFKEELDNLYNKIVARFEDKAKETASENTVVEVKVTDAEEFNARVTEINNKFDTIGAELQAEKTARAEAETALANLKAEAENLKAENLKLSGGKIDQPSGADPAEGKENIVQDPFKKMAQELKSYASKSR